MTDTIRFDDGAAYERMMGQWSRLVGTAFLDWLAPAPGLDWIDIGCGNGAFAELIVERAAPAALLGVDPSAAQLDFARARHRAGRARFEQGVAEALPAPDASADWAVMALVLFFLLDPAKGLAEMRRVVRPGGGVAAYLWDMLEPEGFPMWPMQQALREMGLDPVLPPSAAVSRAAALGALWAEGGIERIEQRAFTVERRFEDFADFWASVRIALAMAPVGRELAAERLGELEARLRALLPGDADGAIRYRARANAITGRVPEA